MEDEYWREQLLLTVPVDQCVYGRRHLGEPKFSSEPVRLEYLPDRELYLVHDGRHRIEWAKLTGQPTISARVIGIGVSIL